jgi:hypothetical protein
MNVAGEAMHQRPRILAAASAAIVFSVSSFAMAAPVDVAPCDAAYADLDYAKALSCADTALDSTGLDHDQLVRATRVAAFAAASLGEHEKARDRFIRLLAYDPDFKLDPKSSSRLQEPFSEARGYWRAQPSRPGIVVQTQLQQGATGRISVTLSDPTHIVQSLEVGYRWSASSPYTVTQLSATGAVDVLEPAAGGLRLEQYVVALDKRSSVIFMEGTSATPIVRFATAKAPDALAAKTNVTPWLIGGGVAAAALAVGGFFLLRPTTFDPSGRVRTSFSAQCGGAACN